MKNAFAMDSLTNTYAGAPLVVRTIGERDEAVARKQAKQTEEEKNLEKVASLPRWLSFAGMIAFGLGLCVAAGFADAFTGEDAPTFAEAYARAGWLLIVGAVALVVGAAILLFAFIRRKKAMGSAAYRYSQENAQRIVRESFGALGVPEGADEIDVIGVVYKNKKGGGWQSSPFLSNMIYRRTAVFCEDECLCFATVEEVFKIPLARISAIRTEKSRVFAFGWNKEVAYNKGRYREYRLRANDGGMVGGKPSYKIIFRDENYEDYYVHVPCYDIGPVLKLTGRTAE